MKKSNWKTTSIGILAIVTALAGATKTYLATGTIPDITAIAAAVLSGWGLVQAKDSDSRI